jgi:hypothetical protein
MKKIILMLLIVAFVSCKKEKVQTLTNTEMLAQDTTEIILPEKPIEERGRISTSYSNIDENANPCIISEDFIKQDLRHPSTADFSMFDCSTDKNSDGTYTILRKVAAKNSLGVESSFIYKVTLGFKGGNWVDMSNWTLIKMQSEEYK